MRARCLRCAGLALRRGQKKRGVLAHDCGREMRCMRRKGEEGRLRRGVRLNGLCAWRVVLVSAALLACAAWRVVLRLPAYAGRTNLS